MNSMELSLQRMHDLEVRVSELENVNASQVATIEMQADRLKQQQQAHRKTLQELDHYRTFATELATRIVVVQEGLAQMLEAAKHSAELPPIISNSDVLKLSEDDEARLKALTKRLAPEQDDGSVQPRSTQDK